MQTECLLPRSQHLAKVLNISKSLLSRCAPYFLSFFFPLFSPSLLLFYPYFHQSKIIISVLVPLALLVVIIHQTFSQFQCLIFLLHRHRTSRLLVCVCVCSTHLLYWYTLYLYLRFTSCFANRDTFVLVPTYRTTPVSVFNHTRVLQEKVYEEMTRIFEGSDRRSTKDDLEQMKYLDRVIKETLRLYPSASCISRITETDVQIGELKIAISVCTLFILPAI